MGTTGCQTRRDDLAGHAVDIVDAPDLQVRARGELEKTITELGCGMCESLQLVGTQPSTR